MPLGTDDVGETLLRHAPNVTGSHIHLLVDFEHTAIALSPDKAVALSGDGLYRLTCCEGMGCWTMGTMRGGNLAGGRPALYDVSGKGESATVILDKQMAVDVSWTT